LCGIVGIWSNKNLGELETAKLENALKTLVHRGPDHHAIYQLQNCSLGHSRLAIIDLDTQANQPFHSADGKYSLAFNGEIYNFQELREDLITAGYEFKTSSDTEVLLYLLIRRGKAALAELDGFFSFAFYDHERNELLLARDRFGIKPLLYSRDEHQVVFGSELTAIAPFLAASEIDKKALNYLFSLTYIPAPETIYKEVKKLQPGHCITVSSNEFKIEKYYNPTVTDIDQSLTKREVEKKLRTMLTNSVKNRLIADVPVGCFLSGGVDSSIIAAIAKRLKSDIKTFSIGFDHPYFNEAEYATIVANHIKTDHTVYTLTKTDFKNNFHDFLNALDEPFADSSAFAVFMLSKKVKKELTVALSGDGADEIFAGYRKHFAEYKLRNMSGFQKRSVKLLASPLSGIKSNRADKFGDLNRKIQKLAAGIGQSNKDRYWNWCQFIDTRSREKLLQNNFISLRNPIESIAWNKLSSILLADQQFVLPNDMLKKVDQMSMAHALEVRTPFLDHKIVEFANNLPIEMKLNDKGGKRILKAAFSDYLPAEIFNRNKKGFEIPIFEWLNEEIDQLLSGPLFRQDFLKQQGVFSFEAIQEVKLTWKKANAPEVIYLVWSLIIFQHWWQRMQQD
jgi:asparagine synthase (glutamine-hydrolysing)